jgi:hypothetical protein
MTRSMAVAAALGAAISFTTVEAGAVQLTAGVIEQSGTNATVDLWYFTMSAALPVATGVNLTPINGPFTFEDMGLLVFTDVGGTLGALIGQAGVAGDATRSARVDFAALAPGNYIAVVSASDLVPADIAPFQNDPAVSVPIQYELVIDLAGGNDATYTCSIEGNLDGTWTKSPASASCVVPSGTPVPAPGSLGLLLAGVAGLAGIGAARRRA